MRQIAWKFAYSGTKYLVSFKLSREPTFVDFFTAAGVKLREIIYIRTARKYGSGEGGILRIYERISPPLQGTPPSDHSQRCVEKHIKKFWQDDRTIVKLEYDKYREEMLRRLPSGTRNNPSLWTRTSSQISDKTNNT
jgi:hypothetical protein